MDQTSHVVSIESPEPGIRMRSPLRFALRRLAQNRLAIVGAVLFAVMLIGAFGAPFLAPYNYDEPDFTSIWSAPSGTHLLGTDKVGRDIYSRILYGTRSSLIVGFLTLAFVLVIGVLLGALAGMIGGMVDYLIMRVVDIMASFPSLLFAILIMSMLGAGIEKVVIALVVPGWVGICQLTRAQILSLRERDYVIASQSFGANSFWVIRQHMVPNAAPPLLVNATLAIPSYIVAEAGLSYLGMGILPPTPSLGQLVLDASIYIIPHPSYIFFAATALALLILAIAFVGDGLREALDPHALT